MQSNKANKQIRRSQLRSWQITVPGIIAWSAVIAVTSAGELIPSLAAVVIHESGHIAAAKALGERIDGIKLNPFGAEISAARARSYRDEIIVSAAGALANIAAAAVFFALSRIFTHGIFRSLAVCSLIPAAMNMLPLRALDGGAVLIAALSMRLHPDSAERTVRAVSAVTLALLWLGAVYILLSFGEGLSLLLLCFYLFAEIFAPKR